MALDRDIFGDGKAVRYSGMIRRWKTTTPDDDEDLGGIPVAIRNNGNAAAVIAVLQDDNTIEQFRLGIGGVEVVIVHKILETGTTDGASVQVGYSS